MVANMEHVTVIVHYNSISSDYHDSIVSPTHAGLLHDLFLYSVIISTVMKLWQPTE